MLIRCIRCKDQFEQQLNEISCGCKPTKKYECRRLAMIRWREKQAQPHYLLRMARHFQNPMYQWIQEYITTESFTHYQTFKKQADNY